jgi:hypothetical protein
VGRPEPYAPCDGRSALRMSIFDASSTVGSGPLPFSHRRPQSSSGLLPAVARTDQEQDAGRARSPFPALPRLRSQFLRPLSPCRPRTAFSRASAPPPIPVREPLNDARQSQVDSDMGLRVLFSNIPSPPSRPSRRRGSFGTRRRAASTRSPARQAPGAEPNCFACSPHWTPG